MERLKVAAVQLEARLGNRLYHLQQAEEALKEAAALGAQWVALPEFLTTAMAFHPSVGAAIEPFPGPTYAWLEEQARLLNLTIGASWIVRLPSGALRNRFVLMGPSGLLGYHDKDIPTMWENAWYEGGEDEGLIRSPLGPVGAALCWEFLRAGTARRLRGNVRLVVGGSCWWDVPENLPGTPLWRWLHRQNVALWQNALPTFSRLVGAPIIHGNWCGQVRGSWALGTPYRTRYIASAQVVERDGTVMAERPPEEGFGIVVTRIDVGEPQPQGEVPENFWLHPLLELPHWRFFWWMQNAHGRRYRRRVTEVRQRLKGGRDGE
ncbi:MAG: carbon-nitrogen hydrolase family protein [Bacillota bacterium]|nr:carbon-nitrogen hydrolase family protein [Bacillota bacterium]